MTDHSFGGVWAWLTTASHWTGSDGVEHRLWQHLGYSLEAIAIAALIAVPLGLYAGHTNRGGAVLTSLGNAGRALPTLGLLVLFAIEIGVGLNAAIIPLVLLAIPPILVNTYEGIRGIPGDLADAAQGMGLHPLQVLFRVEVPVSLPLIMLGLRLAALQVVATTTVAAYVGVGGLGRYIIDGQASRNYAELGAGAILVVLFALVTEGLFLVALRAVVSPGVRGRSRAS